MLYLKKGTVGIDFYTGSELQIKFVVHGEKISCAVLLLYLRYTNRCSDRDTNITIHVTCNWFTIDLVIIHVNFQDIRASIQRTQYDKL